MTFTGDAKDFCGLHAEGATLASVASAADFNSVITALGKEREDFLCELLMSIQIIHSPSFQIASRRSRGLAEPVQSEQGRLLRGEPFHLRRRPNRRWRRLRHRRLVHGRAQLFRHRGRRLHHPGRQRGRQ